MKNIAVSEKVHEKLKSYTKKEGVKMIDVVEGLINEFITEKVERFENINFDRTIFLTFNRYFEFPNSIRIKPLERLWNSRLFDVLYQKTQNDILLVCITIDNSIDEDVIDAYSTLNSGRLLGKVKIIKMTPEEYKQHTNTFNL